MHKKEKLMLLEKSKMTRYKNLVFLLATRALNVEILLNHIGGKIMENTVIEQANGTEIEKNQESRTFTQEELDNIVSNRLKRESAKYADYEELKEKASKFDEIEEASKSELQKATEKADALQKQIDSMTKEKEIRELREKVAKDTGVPVGLLMGATEEDCMEQAYNILAFKNESAKTGYPVVKDGGEVRTPPSKKSAQDQFADWFNASIN